MAGDDVPFLAARPGDRVAPQSPDSFCAAAGRRIGLPTSLRVTVRDAVCGRAIEGAELSLDDATGASVCAGVLSDAQGHARFEPIPAGTPRTLRIVAIAAGWWPPDLAIPVALGDGSDPTDAVVELWPTREIRGVVVTEDGRPVADADVERRATTDEAGRFVLSGIAPGARRIEARGGGMEGRADVDATAAEVRITVRPEAEELEVAVSGPQGEVPAVVREAFRGMRPEVRDGRCVIRPDSRGGLDGWALLYAPEDSEGRRLPWAPLLLGPVPRGTRRVVARFQERRPISGRVLDPEGGPVPGIAVRAAPPGLPRSGGIPVRSVSVALSDETGAFSLGACDAGDQIVWAEAGERTVPLEPRQVAGGTTGLELRVERSADARVLVTDPNGRPLGRARVRFEPDSPPDAGIVTETDVESGVAVFRGLRPYDRGRLTVDPEFAPGHFLVHVTPAWSPAPTTVRLAPALSVQGTVVDAEAGPVENVWVFGRGGGVTGAVRSGDGRFVLWGFPPGPVDLWASCGDGGGVDLSERPLPGMPVRRVVAGASEARIVVEAGGELTVLWPADADEREQAVSALCAGSSFDPTGPLLLPAIEGAGRLLVRGLRVRTDYTLWLHTGASGRCALVTGLRAGPPRVVTLGPGLAIRGRLRGPAALVDPYVHAKVGPLTAEGRVHADGTFEIGGLPPGRFVVVAGDESTPDGAWRGEAAADAGAEVDVALARVPAAR